MVLFVAALLTVGAVAFILAIRVKDLPEEAGESPTQHLEDKKARVYEALRDLNFEYRVGKLSEADYQKTRDGLQRDLARVTAEIDAAVGVAPPPKTAPQAPVAEPDELTCPHCAATFSQPLKFCGECGKPMRGEA